MSYEEPMRSGPAGGSTALGFVPWATVFALCLSLGCDARQVAAGDGGAADSAADLQTDLSRDLPTGEVQTSCLETLRAGSAELPCIFSPDIYASCHVRDECCDARAGCYQHATRRQPYTCRAGRSTSCAGVAFELSLSGPTGSLTLSKAWLTLGVGFDRYITLIFADGPTLETCVTPRLSVNGDLTLGTQQLLALLATDSGPKIAEATLTLTKLPDGNPPGPLRVTGSLSIPAWQVEALSFTLDDCAELRSSGS